MISFLLNYFSSLYKHEIITSTEQILFRISLIWYLPKIFITPVYVINFYFLKYRETEAELISLSRRDYLSKIFKFSAIIPYFIVADGFVRTNYNVELKRIKIKAKKYTSTEPLKIVQISDLHTGTFPDDKFLHAARIVIESMKPDLIVITGDFINSELKEIDLIVNELSLFNAPFGVFACLGNHEHYIKTDDTTQIIKIIRDTGIELLVNENRTIEIHNSKIQICAIDSITRKHNFANFANTFNSLDPSLYTILLAHYPYIWEELIVEKTCADLTLSGHTHGGQIGIDLGFFAFTVENLINKPMRGLITKKDQMIYINRGLGVFMPPLRIGIRPEITLFEIEREDNII
ncbi:MAG: metallophosphoesterase [Candidatus Kapabacteria bacterium]|nr:metallophosphoesterase [Candidatus Kapabacteria bacterium]